MSALKLAPVSASPASIIEHLNGMYVLLGSAIRTQNLLATLEAFSRSYVAGGAIVSLALGEDPKDYDVWFRSTEDWQAAVDGMRTGLVRVSKYSYTYVIDGKEIQLVKSRVGEPDEVAGSFDFKHCNCYYTADGLLKADLPYIQSKRLDFVRGNLCHPVNTFQRVLKFSRRGYNVTNKTLSDLMNETGEIYQKRQAAKSFAPSNDDEPAGEGAYDVFFPGWGGGGEDGGSR